ncbi:polyprotein [Grapevine-associated poty-like virus 1]|nr:polyprotein [Grapevine-associated poty-like virus 1]QXN75423.1 MAG: polyprotein [Grapevine-associated poty-like virus 1]
MVEKSEEPSNIVKKFSLGSSEAFTFKQEHYRKKFDFTKVRQLVEKHEILNESYQSKELVTAESVKNLIGKKFPGAIYRQRRRNIRKRFAKRLERFGESVLVKERDRFEAIQIEIAPKQQRILSEKRNPRKRVKLHHLSRNFPRCDWDIVGSVPYVKMFVRNVMEGKYDHLVQDTNALDVKRGWSGFLLKKQRTYDPTGRIQWHNDYCLIAGIDKRGKIVSATRRQVWRRVEAWYSNENRSLKNIMESVKFTEFNVVYDEDNYESARKEDNEELLETERALEAITLGITRADIINKARDEKREARMLRISNQVLDYFDDARRLADESLNIMFTPVRHWNESYGYGMVNESCVSFGPKGAIKVLSCCEEKTRMFSENLTSRGGLLVGDILEAPEFVHCAITGLMEGYCYIAIFRVVRKALPDEFQTEFDTFVIEAISQLGAYPYFGLFQIVVRIMTTKFPFVIAMPIPPLIVDHVEKTIHVYGLDPERVNVSHILGCTHVVHLILRLGDEQELLKYRIGSSNLDRPMIRSLRKEKDISLDTPVLSTVVDTRWGGLNPPIRPPMENLGVIPPKVPGQKPKPSVPNEVKPDAPTIDKDDPEINPTPNKLVLSNDFRCVWNFLRLTEIEINVCRGNFKTMLNPLGLSLIVHDDAPMLQHVTWPPHKYTRKGKPVSEKCKVRTAGMDNQLLVCCAKRSALFTSYVKVNEAIIVGDVMNRCISQKIDVRAYKDDGLCYMMLFDVIEAGIFLEFKQDYGRFMKNYVSQLGYFPQFAALQSVLRVCIQLFPYVSGLLVPPLLIHHRTKLMHFMGPRSFSNNRIHTANAFTVFHLTTQVALEDYLGIYRVGAKSVEEAISDEIKLIGTSLQMEIRTLAKEKKLPRNSDINDVDIYLRDGTTLDYVGGKLWEYVNQLHEQECKYETLQSIMGRVRDYNADEALQAIHKSISKFNNQLDVAINRRVMESATQRRQEPNNLQKNIGFKVANLIRDEMCEVINEATEGKFHNIEEILSFKQGLKSDVQHLSTCEKLNCTQCYRLHASICNFERDVKRMLVHEDESRMSLTGDRGKKLCIMNQDADQNSESSSDNTSDSQYEVLRTMCSNNALQCKVDTNAFNLRRVKLNIVINSCWFSRVFLNLRLISFVMPKIEQYRLMTSVVDCVLSFLIVFGRWMNNCIVDPVSLVDRSWVQEKIFSVFGFTNQWKTILIYMPFVYIVNILTISGAPIDPVFSTNIIKFVTWHYFSLNSSFFFPTLCLLVRFIYVYLIRDNVLVRSNIRKMVVLQFFTIMIDFLFSAYQSIVIGGILVLTLILLSLVLVNKALGLKSFVSIQHDAMQDGRVDRKDVKKLDDKLQGTFPKQKTRTHKISEMLVQGVAFITLILYTFDKDVALVVGNMLKNLSYLTDMVNSLIINRKNDIEEVPILNAFFDDKLQGDEGSSNLINLVLGDELTNLMERVMRPDRVNQTHDCSVFMNWFQALNFSTRVARDFQYISVNEAKVLTNINSDDVANKLIEDTRSWQIVIGATGTGKSTKLPYKVYMQLLAKEVGSQVKIIICQPTIAASLNCQIMLSQLFGKKVYMRADSVSSGDWFGVSVYTHGALMYRIANDRTFMKEISVIFLDEFHVVSPELLQLETFLNESITTKKVLVSATPRVGRVSEMPSPFSKKIINVPSMSFENFINRQGFGDCVDMTGEGNRVLLFMCGRNECDSAARRLTKAGWKSISLHRGNFKENLPQVKSLLAENNQQAVFVVSNNTLEVGVTLDITHVVDFGFTIQPCVDLDTKVLHMSRLMVTDKERAQRIGRVGRLSDGTALAIGKADNAPSRLTDESAYKAMLYAFIWDTDYYLHREINLDFLSGITRSQAYVMLSLDVPVFLSKELVESDGSVNNVVHSWLKSRVINSLVIKTFKGTILRARYESWPKMSNVYDDKQLRAEFRDLRLPFICMNLSVKDNVELALALRTLVSGVDCMQLSEKKIRELHITMRNDPRIINIAIETLQAVKSQLVSVLNNYRDELEHVNSSGLLRSIYFKSTVVRIQEAFNKDNIKLQSLDCAIKELQKCLLIEGKFDSDVTETVWEGSTSEDMDNVMQGKISGSEITVNWNEPMVLAVEAATQHNDGEAINLDHFTKWIGSKIIVRTTPWTQFDIKTMFNYKHLTVIMVSSIMIMSLLTLYNFFDIGSWLFQNRKQRQLAEKEVQTPSGKKHVESLGLDSMKSLQGKKMSSHRGKSTKVSESELLYDERSGSRARRTVGAMDKKSREERGRNAKNMYVLEDPRKFTNFYESFDDSSVKSCAFRAKGMFEPFFTTTRPNQEIDLLRVRYRQYSEDIADINMTPVTRWADQADEHEPPQTLICQIEFNDGTFRELELTQHDPTRVARSMVGFIGLDAHRGEYRQTGISMDTRLQSKTVPNGPNALGIQMWNFVKHDVTGTTFNLQPLINDDEINSGSICLIYECDCGRERLSEGVFNGGRWNLHTLNANIIWNKTAISKAFDTLCFARVEKPINQQPALNGISEITPFDNSNTLQADFINMDSFSRRYVAFLGGDGTVLLGGIWHTYYIITNLHLLKYDGEITVIASHTTFKINRPDVVSFKGIDVCLIPIPVGKLTLSRDTRVRINVAPCEPCKVMLLTKYSNNRLGVMHTSQTVIATRARENRWNYAVKTGSGQCGSPVVRVDSSVPEIIGVHSNTTMTDHANQFAGFDERVIKALTIRPDSMVPSPWQFSYELAGYSFERVNAKVDGLQICYKPLQSKDSKTSMPPWVSSEVGDRVWESFAKVPQHMLTTTMYKGYNEEFDMFCDVFVKEFGERAQWVKDVDRLYHPSALNQQAFLRDIKKYNVEFEDFDRKIFGEAVQDVVNILKDHIKKCRIKTPHEVLSAIKYSTAAGPMYGCSKADLLAEKTDEEMEDLAIRCRDHMYDVPYVPGVWKASLKDELRTKEKFLLNKTRVFTAAPVETVLGAKAFVDDFNEQFYAAHLSIPSTVGITKFYGGWEKLFESLYTNGWWFGSGDGHAFDSRLTPDILQAVCYIRKKFSEPSMHSPLENLYTEIIHTPIAMPDHTVLLKKHGNNSGQPSTVVDNTLCMMIGFQYAFRRLVPEQFHGYEYGVPTSDGSEWRKQRDVYTYFCNGDDNIYSCHHDVKKYLTMEGLRKVLLEIGFDYEFDTYTTDIFKCEYMSLQFRQLYVTCAGEVTRRIMFQMGRARLFAILQWKKHDTPTAWLESARAALLEGFADVQFVQLARAWIDYLTTKYDPIFKDDKEYQTMKSSIFSDEELLMIHMGIVLLQSDVSGPTVKLNNIQNEPTKRLLDLPIDNFITNYEEAVSQLSEKLYEIDISTVENNSLQMADFEAIADNRANEGAITPSIGWRPSPSTLQVALPNIGGAPLFDANIISTFKVATTNLYNNVATTEEIETWCRTVKETSQPPITTEADFKKLCLAFILWCANNGTSSELDTTSSFPVHATATQDIMVPVAPWIAATNGQLRRHMRFFSEVCIVLLKQFKMIPRLAMQRGITLSSAYYYAFDFIVITPQIGREVRDVLAKSKGAALEGIGVSNFVTDNKPETKPISDKRSDGRGAYKAARPVGF